MVCYVCEKPSKPRAHYCERCREFILHKPDHLARQVMKALARRPEGKPFDKVILTD